MDPEQDNAFVWPPLHWPAPGGVVPVPPPEVEPIEQAAAVTVPTVPVPAAPVVPPPVEVLPPVVDAQTGTGLPAQTTSDAVATLPPVDAVSGVDADPVSVPPPVETQEADATAPAETDSPYIDPLSPSSWNKPLSTADLYTMAKRDPVAYAQHIQTMDAVAAEEQQRREHLVKTQNAVKEEQDYQDLVASQAKANAMRDQLLATKVDANRWRESRSVPQSIAAFLSVVVGGLYQARKGGPNIGLEIIDRAIDRDIAEQQANIADKRNAIADLRAQGLSDFQAHQAYRIAWYQRALDDVKTSMQDYDPAGTTARQHVQQALELESRIAQAAELGRQAKLKEELVRRKDERESLKAYDDHLKAQADLAKMQARGTGAGPVRPPEYFKALGLPMPPWPMSDKEHAQWMQHQKTAQDLVPADPNSPKARKERADASKAEADAAASADGYKIANPETGTPLANKDGKEFVVMDTDERKRLRSIGGAAANIRKLADKMSELKKKNGGNWKALGSDEAQEIQSLVSMLDFETFKAFDLGAPSEGDKALAEGVRGGVDPSSFVKNAAKGFQAYADAVEKKALGHYRAAGYTGPAIKFSRASDLPPPKATVTDELLERAMKTEYTPSTSLATAAANATPHAQKINSDYEMDVKGLAAQAEFAPDEQTKRAARAALEQLAEKHPTEGGRALAAEALKAIPGTTPKRER